MIYFIPVLLFYIVFCIIGISQADWAGLDKALKGKNSE